MGLGGFVLASPYALPHKGMRIVMFWFLLKGLGFGGEGSRVKGCKVSVVWRFRAKKEFESLGV